MQFVGREAEISLVLAEIGESLDLSSGRTVLLIGATGLGKTALANEVIRQLQASRSSVTIASGRCRPPAADVEEPYQPFVSALHDLTNQTASDGVSREALSSLLRELAPYWLSAVPMFGSVLAAGFSTVARLRAKKPVTPQEHFSQYLRLIEGMASRGPLVLFLDDFHLAGPGSLALLSHLARSVRRLPIAILVAMSDEIAADAEIHSLFAELERERLGRRVALGGLSPAAVATLLQAELGQTPDEALIQWFFEAGDGNPLLTRELCRLLRESGGIDREQGVCSLSEAGRRMSVPRNAEAAVSARLQRLAPGDVQLLQYASVQGLEFNATVLASLLGEDELSVLERLERLAVSSGLVRPAGEEVLPDGDLLSRFRFDPAPARSVLYGQVVGKRRILLHRRAAEVLESLCGKSSSEWMAERIAWHWQEARVPERAITSIGGSDFGASHRDTLRAEAAASAGAAATAARAAAARDQAEVFVGREAELAELAGELSSAIRSGVGRTVFIQGPPGAGKTTLVNELLERLGREGTPVTVARGRCLPSFEGGDPYLPFVEAVRDLADESSFAFSGQENFGSLLADIAPYWISAVPAVGNLLSAALATAAQIRARSAPAAAPSREALFIQYVELIGRLSARSPLVLFLDDLHWADPSSIALLEHLARGIARHPVLLIGTLRGEEVERGPLGAALVDLQRDGRALRLELEELKGGELEALLTAELGGAVAEPLRRWIVEAAGGNPLFASELCRLLRESGAALEIRGEWHLTAAASDLGIPRSAEAVIEDRVRRLPPDDLRLLQYASVDGADFDSGLLARLLQSDELLVLEGLRRLEDAHFVRTAGEMRYPCGDVATVLEFRHALIQTVVYRKIAGKRRVLLHRLAGEILEEMYGGSSDSVAGRLARHFHAGRRSEPAHRYARLAADAARRIYAHWEAEELFKIALQHSPSDADTAAIQERLGNICDTVGYYAQALNHYGDALQRLTGDAAASLRLRSRMVIMERTGGLAAPQELLGRVEALLAEAAEYPRERCYLLLELGRIADTQRALQANQSAVDVAERIGDPSLLAPALEQLAVALMFAGRTREALPHLSRALSVSGAAENPRRAALNHNVAGVAQARLGAYRVAQLEFTSMLEIFERLGDANGVSCACGCLGCLLNRLGEFDTSEEMSRRATEIQVRRDRASLLQTLFNFAEQARLTRQLSTAVERYDGLYALAEELGAAPSQAIAQAGKGLCLIASGDWMGAEKCRKLVLGVTAGSSEWFEDRDMVEIFLARMEASEEKGSAAITRLAAAAAILRSADVYLWARVEVERAALLGAGDAAAGLDLLDDVATAAREVEAPPLHAHIEEVRASLLRQLSPVLVATP